MKACILTYEFSYNYGAVLQATALMDILRQFGYEVDIINRGWGKREIAPKHSSVKNRILGLIGKYYSCYAFDRFKTKHWNLTSYAETDEELRELVGEYDVVIVGSDQIWNAECLPTQELYYFGVHAEPESQKLIAYAPSFGKDVFKAESGEIKKIKKLLSKYTAISVREDSGKEILKDIFGIEAAEVVLDPTMLHDSDYYCRLAGINKSCNNGTLAYYFLDPTPGKMKALKELASAKRLKPIEVNKPVNRGGIISKIKSLRYPSPESWLRKIAKADYVLTDSFHGTVFSIIFGKSFTTFTNEKRGNARFESLLGRLGLMSRLTTPVDFDILETEGIDYSDINRQLKKMQHNSINWLRNALERRD